MNTLKFIALFLSITTLTYAIPEGDQLERELSQPTSNLEHKAKNLSALATVKHREASYQEAISLYSQSLNLRSQLGEKGSGSFATILFLKAIAEHKAGDSCTAANDAKQAIGIFAEAGEIDMAIRAEKEGFNEFNEACQVSLAGNF